MSFVAAAFTVMKRSINESGIVDGDNSKYGFDHDEPNFPGRSLEAPDD